MQQPESAPADPGPPQNSPIAQGELLMRRVPDQPKMYKSKRVQQGTFLPRKHPRDEDGLSVSRRQTAEHTEFLTPEQFKANCTDAKMRVTSGVLCLSVDDIRRIVGPGVRPEPTPADPARHLVADPGHSVIPEISSKFFDGPESTEETREKIRLLAADLVHRVIEPLAIEPG